MSKNKFPDRFFITGTDTGVGKTFIAAILAAGLGAHYWKPLQCGLDSPTDSEVIGHFSGAPEKILPEAYRFKAPMSPHAASRLEDITVSIDEIELPDCEGSLIVEGAGGVLVPLNDRELMIDLIKKIALPVLLVARSSLGTINHTLLSLQALRLHDIDIAGVIMNGEKNESNRQAIEYYGRTKVLAEVEHFEDIEDLDYMGIFNQYFS